MATQCLLQRRPMTCEVRVEGSLKKGVTAKDIILALIAKIGVAGGVGYVLEYTGPAIRALSMEERMTVCNMSIEAGARAGLIAPDETTFEYLAGRKYAPKGADWDAAVKRWRELPSDEGAKYDRTVTLDVSDLDPMITFGTNPGMGMPITASIPTLESAPDGGLKKALAYMDLPAGQPLLGHKVDVVFIGSCTNSRLSDLREAARVFARPQGGRGRACAGGARLTADQTRRRSRRSRQGLHGCGRGMARSRLQHVHCHERRHDPARPICRQHQQPQLRRPSGQGRAHAVGQPADRRGRGCYRCGYRRTHPAG